MPYRYHQLEGLQEDLVDAAVEAAGGDEARQLAVDVVLGDAEGLRHVGQRQAAVRLEQLRVGQDAHLAHVVPVVVLRVPVLLHVLLDARQVHEEVAVPAVVQRKQVLLHLHTVHHKFYWLLPSFV